MPLGADISAQLLNGMVPSGGHMIQRMGRLIETGTDLDNFSFSIGEQFILERSFSTEANDTVCRRILFVDFTAQWPHCRQYFPRPKNRDFPISHYVNIWIGDLEHFYIFPIFITLILIFVQPEFSIVFFIPSGEHTKSNGKSQFFMGKSTISMAIFNSFLYVHQRVYLINIPLNHYKIPLNHHKSHDTRGFVHQRNSYVSHNQRVNPIKIPLKSSKSH